MICRVKACGLTETDFARAAGHSPTTLSNLKRGRWGGRVATLKDFERAARDIELARLRDLAARYPQEAVAAATPQPLAAE